METSDQGLRNVTVLPSSIHKNVVEQGRNSFFYHAARKFPFFHKSKVYLISQFFLLSPSVARHVTLLEKERRQRESECNLVAKNIFSRTENGVTFSLSAVTLLMWSLFFKIKSPLFAHDVFGVKKKTTTSRQQEERGRRGRNKWPINQEKPPINFFPRKSTRDSSTIIFIFSGGHFPCLPR